MKKLLLSLTAVVTCLSVSAAVPTLKDQFSGSFNVTQEKPNYSNPSAYDADGNLIITGAFNNTFGSYEAVGTSAYIVKYNKDNSEAWKVGIIGSATITSIDTDADGNIYVAGALADEVVFGSSDGVTMTKTGLKIDGNAVIEKSASFIAKYDKAGKVVAVSSFVPEPLPYLAAKADYSPTGGDLYFRIPEVKVDGGKVYASAYYTGKTTIGSGSFEGAYTNLYDLIFFDVQNLGIFSVDCAALNNAEIVAKMNLVGPFNDTAPAIEEIAFDVKNGQVVAGFTMTTGEYKNDVSIELGSYKEKVTPTKGVVDYVILKNGAVSSMKKAATSALLSYDGLNDIIIGDDVYVVGSYDTDKPATSLAEIPVAPAGKSDIFVAKVNFSDLSAKEINSNGIEEAEGRYEMVGSAALVDRSLYINTVDDEGLGSSYWFDGSSFSAAPVKATGVATVKDMLALVSSDAAKVDYKTYTYSYGQSGIADIDAEFDENAPVEYYNLQGIRVTNPENGLYIRRQGSKVQKVIL